MSSILEQTDEWSSCLFGLYGLPIILTLLYILLALPQVDNCLKREIPNSNFRLLFKIIFFFGFTYIIIRLWLIYSDCGNPVTTTTIVVEEDPET